MFMKLGATLILRATVYLIGLIVVGLCLVALPAGIMSDKTGEYRYILGALYITAVPFFFALYQAIKLIDYIDNDNAFSLDSINALKNIKKCGLIISGLFTLGMPYVYYVADKDDAPGVIALGLVIIGASFVIATSAAVFQSLLQSAVDMKTENDLTV